MTAALAFEMVHNLAMEWSRYQKNKYSYCLGVANGLHSLAVRERYDEEKRAKQKEKEEEEKKVKEEKAARQRELDRLRDPSNVITIEDESDPEDQQGVSPETLFVKSEYDRDEKPCLGRDFLNATDTTFGPEQIGAMNRDFDRDFLLSLGLDGGMISDESDDEVAPTFKEEDEEPLNLDEDLDRQLRAMASSQPAIKREECSDSLTPKMEPEADGTIATWNSYSALVLYRNSAEEVAKDYLKNKNIKLRKSRKREINIRDHASYNAGVKDSEKIDIKRRKIDEKPFQ